MIALFFAYLFEIFAYVAFFTALTGSFGLRLGSIEATPANIRGLKNVVIIGTVAHIAACTIVF